MWHNNLFGAAWIALPPAKIGAISAALRGYQGLSARLAASTTDEQAGGPGRMFMHGQRWA
jgi:hypothetical protein